MPAALRAAPQQAAAQAAAQAAVRAAAGRAAAGAAVQQWEGAATPAAAPVCCSPTCRLQAKSFEAAQLLSRSINRSVAAGPLESPPQFQGGFFSEIC